VLPVTGLLGDMLGVETVGGLLAMVVDVDAESEPPYPSAVLAVQVNEAPTGAIALLRVILFPVPTTPLLIYQVYVTDTDSPSGSDALLEQVTVL